MQWSYENTMVTLDGPTLRWGVSYEDCGREYSTFYEQPLSSFATRGPAHINYPFYEIDVPLDIIQAISPDQIPSWYKPLHPDVIKVFDTARSPRNATKDLEALYLADIPIDETDGCGFTPVWYAARFGEPESVIALLGCGARIDRIYPHVYGYESLLHAAVSSGYPDLVEKLLQKGLDPNLIDSLGRTPHSYLNHEPSLHRRTAPAVSKILRDRGGR